MSAGRVSKIYVGRGDNELNNFSECLSESQYHLSGLPKDGNSMTVSTLSSYVERYEWAGIPDWHSKHKCMEHMLPGLNCVCHALQLVL